MAIGVILTIAVPASAWAQPIGPKEKDTATRNGFYAAALIVKDPDWREKWNTEPSQIPQFTTGSRLQPGEFGALLTFFSGATPKQGRIAISCDLAIHYADGTQKQFPAKPCAEDVVAEADDNLRMTRLEIELRPGTNDPAGIVRFDIGITDLNASVRLPLSVAFELKKPHGSPAPAKTHSSAPEKTSP